MTLVALLAGCASDVMLTSAGGGCAEGGRCVVGGGGCTAGEERCDGLVNNCNAVIDECQCQPGEAQPCFDGPPGLEKLGVCHWGTQECSAQGEWGECLGDELPIEEACNGLDDDCDGAIDEGFSCPSGSQGRCYTGPAETEGVGACTSGVRSCNASCAWGACIGEVTQVSETCDGLDNDCNGAVDDGDPGGGAPCYTGYLGVCAEGVMSCVEGSVTCIMITSPSPELCDGLDNDCDGVTEENFVCVNGATLSCYDGPPGTLGVGVCAAGVQLCSDCVWSGPCLAQVLPSPEICDGLDNDCNSLKDDGC